MSSGALLHTCLGTRKKKRSNFIKYESARASIEISRITNK